MLKLVKSTREGLLHQKRVNVANALAVFVNASEDVEICWSEAFDLDCADDLEESERMIAEIALMHDTCLYLWRNYIKLKRDLIREELKSG